MKPLDPRLLRHVASARRWVGLSAGLGVLTAGLVVAQGVLLAQVIATGVAAAGMRGGVGGLTVPLVALVLVVWARAALTGLQERFGHRASTSVTSELRMAVVRHTADLGAAGAGSDAVATATLATRGLGRLDGYLTRYLPHLLLTCTVTPAVLAVVWWFDPVAGLTITLTLPLVPLFMALVGLSTRSSADRALRSLQRLNAQLLDLVAGLPTLRAHGRDRGQVARVREVGDAHRRLTMATLRSAFLSSLVLETLTTLSVALVAVGVGLRLVAGDLDLRTGLVALVLAPEVYLPLRMLGVHYHASADGLAAAEQALAVLDRPVPATGTAIAPDLRTAAVVISGLAVVHGDGGRATPDGLDLVLHPGETVALTGPSGSGKSTAVRVLLGLQRPTRGTVSVVPLQWSTSQASTPALALADIDPAQWRRAIAWVPQQPTLVPGTVRENVLLTSRAAGAPSDDRLDAAARATGLDGVVAGLPGGWDARVGAGGAGLSAGQRQLLALTRALLGDAALVVLDEPTAHLDAASEARVLHAIRSLREAGRTVLLVAHRPALAAVADRVVTVHGGPAEPVRSAPVTRIPAARAAGSEVTA
jgi:ATP-binding cassette subfamily C protein CydD